MSSIFASVINVFFECYYNDVRRKEKEMKAHDKSEKTKKILREFVWKVVSDFFIIATSYFARNF